VAAAAALVLRKCRRSKRHRISQHRARGFVVRGLGRRPAKRQVSSYPAMPDFARDCRRFARSARGVRTFWARRSGCGPSAARARGSRPNAYDAGPRGFLWIDGQKGPAAICQAAKQRACFPCRWGQLGLAANAASCFSRGCQGTERGDRSRPRGEPTGSKRTRMSERSVPMRWMCWGGVLLATLAMTGNARAYDARGPCGCGGFPAASLSAGACGGVAGYGLMPGCCECPPSCCDNAWAGYCQEKARRANRARVAVSWACVVERPCVTGPSCGCGGGEEMQPGAVPGPELAPTRAVAPDDVPIEPAPRPPPAATFRTTQPHLH
jgi:hypothetical protein